MKRKKLNQFLSALVALVMMLTLLPGFTLAVNADGVDADNISGLSDSVFSDLGFDTKTTDIEENLDKKPTTTNPILLAEVPELAVTTRAQTSIYDLDGGNAVRTDIYGSNASDAKSQAGVNIAGENVRSVSFDPDGDAKKGHIAYLSSYNTSNDTYGNYAQVMLTVLNEGDSRSQASINVGVYPFHLKPHSAGAFLSIAAGDYDGDGKQEIAAVVPGWENQIQPNGQCVTIFEYDAAANTLQSGNAAWLNRDMSPALGELAPGIYAAKSEMYEYFSVNIATVPAPDGKCDALAVASSYIRGAEKTKNTNSTSARETKTHSSYLSFWYEPASANSGRTEWHRLTDGWSDVYGFSKNDGYPRYEMMLFPSVAVGDINGDGIPEAVVSGYRMEDPRSVLDNRNLDRKKALITYYSWTEGRYQKSSPMQWFRIDGEQSTGLGRRFFNNYSDNDYASTPFPMAIYAERGTDYRNSIFVAGTVLALPDVEDQEEMQMGYYGAAQEAPETALQQAIVGNEFRIRGYADLENHYKHNTAITEAISGNFSADPTGREQVLFSFVSKHQTAARWDAKLFRMWTSSESTTPVLHTKSIYERTERPTFSIAAPDVDTDSGIMKYNENKAPAFYFSDPNVVAVLQAAPYFAELETVGDGEPETSMTNSEGSGVGTQQAVEVSAGLAIGVGSQFNAVVVKAAEFKVQATAGASGGWQHETELTQTVGVTYATGYEDSVVLTMAPYIRHYYDEWNPETQAWEDAFIDVPMQPRTTMISVDTYDEVAEKNGWKTLRDTALNNSIAGRPETYSADVQNPKSWNLTDFTSKKTDWQAVGTGSGAISQSMSHERTSGHGATWGVSAGASGELQLGVVIVNVDAAVNYTGGAIFSAYKGTEYSGTVPNIPTSQNANYDFEWQFGTHFVDLFGSENEELQEYLHETDQDKVEDYITKNNLDCMVIGYKVRNVKRPPRTPDDFDVDHTTQDSVTLSWSPDKTTENGYYEIARVSGDIYHPIGTVNAGIAGENETLYFVDENCLPGEVYEYAIKAHSGTLPPRSSLWSESIFGITTTEDGSVSFSEQPQDAYVRVGQPANFAVTLALPEGAASVNYQWQVRYQGGKWENAIADTANQRKLVLNNVNDKMNGDSYRCRATVLLDGKIYPLYSNAATLYAGKGETETEIVLSSEIGYADETTTNIHTSTEAYDAAVSVKIGSAPYSVYQYNHSGQEELLLFADGVYYKPDFALGSAIAEAAAGDGRNYGDAVVVTIDNASVLPIKTEQAFYTDAALENVFAGYDAGILNHPYGEIDSKDFPDLGDGYIILDGLLHGLPDGTEGETQYQGKKLAAFTVVTASGATETWYYDWSTSQAVGVRLYPGDDVYQCGEDVYEAFLSSISTYTVPTSGQKKQTSITVTDGEPVNITVSVQERAGTVNPIIPTGSVRFVMTDSSLGGVVETLTANLVNGKATISFTAPYEGDFLISAQYDGNDLLLPSDSKAIYKGISRDANSVLLLPNPDRTAIVYGESVTFAPRTILRSILPTNEILEEDIPADQHKGYAYTVRRSDGMIADGLLTNNTFTPDMPGKYTIELKSTYTPTSGGESGGDSADVVLSKLVTVAVDKGSLTVTAKNQEYMTSEPMFDQTGLTIDGLLSGETAMAEDVFSLQPELPESVDEVTDLPIGTYRINVGIDTEAEAYGKLSEKYHINTISGQLTVTAPMHKLTFSAGANGNLTAAIEGGLTLFSGNWVAENRVVQLSAIPNNGYAVDEWTVTVDGTPMDIGDVSANIQVPATGDISATVRFTPQRSCLTYGVTGSGTLSAKSNSAEGAEIPNGGEVTAQTAVFFEAVPDEGHYIKSWSINGQILMDGNAGFTGGTYRLAGVPTNTEVYVEFAPIDYYDVTFCAINADGLNVGGEVISEDIERNEDGRVRSGSVFTITAIPDLDGMYQISEWRLYDTDGESYTVLQGNVETYTVTALESDLDIRVVFETIAPPVTVSFSVDDPEKGSISAVIAKEPITSGEEQPAYVPVTFTVALQPNCSVQEWRVNDEVQPGETGETFTISRLTEDVTVEAILLQSEPVDRLELDIGIPKAGAEATVVNLDNEQYTGTVEWSPALTNGRFDWGTDYTATITLTAKKGWTFAGIGENAFTVNGANRSETPADSGIITAVFPTTESSVPKITSADSYTVIDGGSFPVTATGKPTIQFSLEGAPDGVTIDPLTGEMTIASGMSTDEYTFTIHAVNTNGESDTQNFTLTYLGGAAPVRKVTVGTQNGSLTAGETGTASFAIVTALIEDGVYPVTLSGAPKGITAEDIEITSGSGTLTLHVSNGVTAGVYPMTAAIDGVTSDNFNLYVAPAGSVPVTSITVAGENGADSITESGGTLQMTAEVLPDNATSKAVIWSVENGTGSAVINQAGLLTAVINGTVTVKATAADGSGVSGELVISISGQNAPALYTVTVNGSHAATTGSGKYIQGATAAIHAGRRSGYAFDGWTASSDSVTFADASSASTTFTMPAEDVTVTASWRRISGGGGGGGGGATTYYTVNFDTNGGSAVESQRIAKNSKAIKPADPEKEGFAFAGWYTDSEGTAEYDFGKAVTGNLTLYAKWTEDTEPTPPPVEPDEWENPFTDVAESDWFYEDVKFSAKNGLFSGMTDTTFAPNGLITRGMMVTVLYRAEGEPDVTGTATFADVDTDAYYAKAVVWGQQNGIIMGYSDTEFAPDQNITREQIAAIMHRYANYKGYDVSAGENTNILSYTDAENISEYAIDAMQYAVGSGLMKGKTDATLNPQDNATRAEIAAILHRFIEANK